MRHTCITIAALLLVAPASGQILHTNPHFLGLDMRIDHAATATAQALGGDLADARVYRMFAQFSSVAPGAGLPYVVVGIVNADITANSGTLYQDPFGGDHAPKSALFPIVPSIQFDSYVSLGSIVDGPDSVYTTPPFAWQSAGVVGDWLNSDPPNLVGQSSFNPGMGVWETFLGQFTLVGIDETARDLAGPSTNRDGRWFGQASIAFNSGIGTQGYLIFDQGFIPAPGSTAIFCLAALAAVRRRR